MNITLNGEQITEVEKKPEEIIGNCADRLILNPEPEKLCEAFYSYLQNKCEKLDYLTNYCGGVLLYKERKISNEQEINKQKSCRLNPPLPSDREGIEKCIGYIDFNSRYYDLSPIISITSVGVSPESKVFELNQKVNNVDPKEIPIMFKLRFNVENPSVGGIHLIGIRANVTQDGSKILSDGIGFSQNLASCKAEGRGSDMSCTGFLKDIPRFASSPFDIERKFQSDKIDSNNSNYTVTGVIDYMKDVSSELISKPFTFKYP